MDDWEQATPEFSGQCSSFSGLRLDAPEVVSRGLEGERTTFQSFANVPWPKVSVVIPTLNEARNLPHVFSKLPPALHEVIIVDGHSADDTVATARRLRPDVRIIKQSRSGKGNALACGFAAATGDIIAMVDADGSADPAEIPRFVRALMDGADFAKGTRFASGGGSSDITRLRRLGNRMLSGLVNVLCGTHYSDLCYGYNAFWRRHVPVFGLDPESPAPADGTRIWGDGFEVETLINIRIAQAGLDVTEVPSYEHPRIHGVSNLNAFHDGRRVLRTILVEHYSYSRRRKALVESNSMEESSRRRSARVLAGRSQLSPPASRSAGGTTMTSERSAWSRAFTYLHKRLPHLTHRASSPTAGCGQCPGHARVSTIGNQIVSSPAVRTYFNASHRSTTASGR